MKKFLKSYGHARDGFIAVFKEEKNFRTEVKIGVAVLALSFIFNFSHIEKALLILLIIFVISAEMINTALEDLCNKIEPSIDPDIKKIKDIMAGFVLVIAGGASLIGILIFGNHFL